MVGVKIVAISGWAHLGQSLRPLAEKIEFVNGRSGETLGRGSNTLFTSPYELELAHQLGFAGAATNCAAYSAYATRLNQVLEEECGDIILVGWSMGGMIALECACLSSKRIAAVILINSCGKFSRDRENACGIEPSLLRTLIKEIRTNKSQVLNNFFTQLNGDTGPLTEEIKRLLMIAQGLDGELLRNGLVYLLERDLRGLLNDLKIPVLILHGRRDAISDICAATDLNTRISNSELVLDDGGHEVSSARGDYLSKQISRFLGEHVFC